MKNLPTYEEFTSITEKKIIGGEQFELLTEAPFGIPSDVLDYYVKRKDGKIATYKWNEFEQLLKDNVGVKFGAYANSKKINIFQVLKNGKILTFGEVYIR